MDIFWWIALAILALVLIHYFEKRSDFDKTALSAGLDSADTVSVLSSRSSEIQELRARLVDLEKQFSIEAFVYVGASGGDGRFSLHYLSHEGSTVVTLTEDAAYVDIGFAINFGSESNEGHFYLTSGEITNRDASFPVTVNMLFVDPSISFSKKAELHRGMVSNYDLKKIDGIDGVVEGMNRMLAILYAYAISRMY